MKNFKTSEDFYNSVLQSVKSGKDTYVFGYALDENSDYQLLKEEKSNDYYVNNNYDLNKLQLDVFIEFCMDNPNIIASLDYVYDEEDDRIYKRLFIFQTSN
jgi:hypothetical protein